MRTRIVLCLLANLAIGPAEAQATVSADGPRGAAERPGDTESAVAPRPAEGRAAEEWLIRGEAMPRAAETPPPAPARRPLKPRDADERHAHAWIIQANHGGPTP